MRKGTKKAAEVKSGKSKVSAVHGAGRTSTQTVPSCFTQYACKALRSSCFFFRRSARYKCVSCPPGVSPILPQSTSNYKAMFPALPPKIPSLGSWLPRIVWSALYLQWMHLFSGPASLSLLESLLPLELSPTTSFKGIFPVFPEWAVPCETTSGRQLLFVKSHITAGPH